MTDAILDAVIAEAMDDADFFGSDGPCPARHEPAGAGSRVLVVTGDNASGKSFFCKYLRAILNADRQTWGRIEIMDGGMHRRTRAGIERAFMYGDEERESTGDLSLCFVLTGLRTCRGRETAHILSLDEPDVGLSEGYQMALGDLLHGFAKDLPQHTTGLIIVTHSRPIIERLAPLAPHFVRVGEDARTTAEWLSDGPTPRSIEELQSLHGQSFRRMQAIQAILDARRAQRRALR